MAHVPLQIQLEYIDEHGNKKLRSFQQNIKIVLGEADFKKKYDPKIATAYELSKASQLRSEGLVAQAKSLSGGSIMRNQMLQDEFAMDVAELNELVDDEVEEWEAEDNQMEIEQVTDKKSYYASYGQERFRSSFDAKMKRMKKKKKQK